MAAVQPHPTPERKSKTKPIRISDLSPDAKQLYQEYEIWLLATRGFQRSTVENKLGHFRRMIGILGVNLTPTLVERYIAELRQTNAAYGTVYSTIQAAEDVMAFIGKPVRFGRPKKPSRRPKDTLTETEIAVIIHHAQDLRERVLLAILAYAGIRNREFCNLRVRDINLAEHYVQVIDGKDVHSYRAAITGECSKLIGEYVAERTEAGAKPEDWLFVTKRHGYQLEQQDLRKIVRVAVKRAGVKKRVSPHLFRHSLAMNMLNRGASLMTIQEQLGHGWVQTTMEYLRGEYTRGKHEYPLTAPRYI